MLKSNLKCFIRQKNKRKEIKNTKTKYLDLIQRDYNDVNNLNIVSTDVTYITSLKNVSENHVFLSVAIHNKTKKIISWSLSQFNDTDLVINTIKDIKHFK